jgi:hypothetical protein
MPERRRTDHRFPGPDTPFWDRAAGTQALGAAGRRRDEAHSAAAALLDDAAQLQVDLVATPLGRVEARTTITNVVGGHDLPTGFVFNREVWLEVIATDATGVIFRSGHRDAQGRLFDELNADVQTGAAPYDEHLVNLRGRLLRLADSHSRQEPAHPVPDSWLVNDGSVLIPDAVLDGYRNANGTLLLPNPHTTERWPPVRPEPSTPLLVETFLQTEADTVVAEGLRPGESRSSRYPIPTELHSAVTVRARLLYRPLPPAVLAIELHQPDLAGLVPVFELAVAVATWPDRDAESSPGR